MAIRRLQVSDFRCVQTATVELDPKFTLIDGPNASGKTSLLEAIYLLGRGRSFRTRRVDRLIRNGCAKFTVFGEVSVGERLLGLGVEGSETGVRAKVSGERAQSLAELAASFPVQIIDPEVHRLIEEGPNRRRRFLDWGVFHVEHGYVDDWQSYQRVLKQRNAALRARLPPAAIEAWNGDLVRLGVRIDTARRRYIDLLAHAANSVTKALLDSELVLTYRSGWSRDRSFEEALLYSSGHDAELGSTTVGPHRAEVDIRLNGTPVKDRISRGQQKLLAAALLLAQVRLFPLDQESRPTLLLDDPAAELDGDRLKQLIYEVAQQSVQLIVTSLTAGMGNFGTPGRRYGVLAGVVREI